MAPPAKNKKKRLLEDDDEKSVESASSSSSSSSSSSAEAVKLTVNKNYAKNYQNRKQREELQRMRDRGEDIDSDESSSEEEDEDGKLLTSSVNLQFLKTIKALKKKDDSIYDKNTRFFEGSPADEDDYDDEEATEEKKKNRKPQRFKDVLREQILEQMDEEENSSKESSSENPKSKYAYDAQQEEIRKSFLKGVEAITGDESGDGKDDWMVVKKRKVANPEADKEVRKELSEIEKLANTAKEKIVDPRGEVEDGEKFLLDFIKNKKWIDKDDDLDNDDDSIDDLDKADEFEANYNFRFEQAEAAAATSGANLSVQTYARGNTVNTVRRADATRKEKREARKERKAAERKAKEEQLKRLKNAKREETKKKLAQIKSVLGSVDQDAVDEVAIMKMLEGDFDPEQFEKAMNETYGDDFYAKEDQEWKTDLDVREELIADEEGEGIVGQDDADGGMYDTYDGEEEEDTNEVQNEEDEEEPWEEDYYEDSANAEETELEKKLKSKMQEELYKLDYEDIVAGMPTRFKYRQVEPNNYGLNAHEILLARDTTLKQFVSLKKMAPYNEEGEHHVGSKKRRRFREALKQEVEEQEKIEKTNENDKTDDAENQNEVVEPKKKRRRLKKGKKKDKDETPELHAETEKDGLKADVESITEVFEDSNDSKNRRRKKKGKKSAGTESNSHDSDDKTLRTVGDSNQPESTSKSDDIDKDSKKRRKHKKKKKEVMGLSASRLSSYGL